MWFPTHTFLPPLNILPLKPFLDLYKRHLLPVPPVLAVALVNIHPMRHAASTLNIYVSLPYGAMADDGAHPISIKAATNPHQLNADHF